MHLTVRKCTVSDLFVSLQAIAKSIPSMFEGTIKLLSFVCSFFAEVDSSSVSENYAELLTTADEMDGTCDIVLQVLYTVVTSFVMPHYHNAITVSNTGFAFVCRVDA